MLSLVIQCEAQCQEQHHLHVGIPGRIHSSYLDREQAFLIVSLCVRIDSFIIYCSVYCCVSISHVSARLVGIVNAKRCCVQYVPDIILTTSLFAMHMHSSQVCTYLTHAGLSMILYMASIAYYAHVL